MQDMFLVKPPPFERVISTVTSLEDAINSRPKA